MAEQKSEIIQVTTKNPKKIEAGKRLAEYNRKKREELKQAPLVCADGSKQCASEPHKGDTISYGIGGLAALGLVGGIGYYFWQSKKTLKTDVPAPHCKPQSNKFEME